MLRVFDTSSLKEIAAIPAHDGGVRCLAIQARPDQIDGAPAIFAPSLAAMATC